MGRLIKGLGLDTSMKEERERGAFLADDQPRTLTRPMVNRVTLIGQVVTPPRLKAVKRGVRTPTTIEEAEKAGGLDKNDVWQNAERWTRYMLSFQLYVRNFRDFNLRIWVRTTGSVGESAAERVQRYDSVLVEGYLCTRTRLHYLEIDGEMRREPTLDTYLRATRVFWLPVRYGQRFRRTHVVMPAGEYARLKRIERESGAQDFEIDRQALEDRLGKLSFEGDPLTEEQVAELRAALEDIRNEPDPGIHPPEQKETPAP